MQKVIAAIAIITVTSCAAVSFTSKEQKNAKYLVQKCFDDELVNCPDKLCEMDSNNVYEILQQVKINVLACVEDGESK
jgi:hypothetical protein